MNINIRKCMISDSPEIFALCKQMLDFDFSEEMFESNLRKLMGTPGNLIIVAENNNRLLGFAHASDYNVLFGNPFKMLSAIAVDEQFRRCGVASALLDAVENWARATGACGIRLCSGTERIAANAFYKARHYDFVKTESAFKKDF